jgi:diguanylate cyclase (GGDEF)-like protein
MMDIDDFKKYNDQLGHLIGDIILREIGDIIKENIREIDFPTRYGGEEFAVVLPYADIETAINVSKRITDALRTHNNLNETTSSVGKITMSMGITRCPQDGNNSDELIQKADAMLYRAKKEGKNKICVMKEKLGMIEHEPSIIITE